MIDLADLKARVSANSLEKLYGDLLEGNSAFYFEEEFPEDHQHRYQLFRKEVGYAFDVDAADTCLIGSAKVGFSLHPDKNFSPFDANKSDFDIVVVSEDGFNSVWADYVDAHYARIGRNFTTQYYNLFRGFLITDDLKGSDKSHSRWEKRLGPFRRKLEEEFYFSSSSKFRIYKSWDLVKRYHIDGLRTLKNRLQK